MTDEEIAALTAALATLSEPEQDAPDSMPAWRRATRSESIEQWP